SRVLSLFVLCLGQISFAVNPLPPVISCRPPGMTMPRLPLFTWMNFVNSFLILIALPVLNAGLAMILIDRRLDGHFFLPFRGGSAVLWQHIFLAFGHPAVYIVAVSSFCVIAGVISGFFPV